MKLITSYLPNPHFPPPPHWPNIFITNKETNTKDKQINRAHREETMWRPRTTKRRFGAFNRLNYQCCEGDGEGQSRQAGRQVLTSFVCVSFPTLDDTLHVKLNCFFGFISLVSLESHLRVGPQLKRAWVRACVCVRVQVCARVCLCVCRLMDSISLRARSAQLSLCKLLIGDEAAFARRFVVVVVVEASASCVLLVLRA